MKLLKTILLTIAAACATPNVAAYDNIAYHCESDTALINQLLRTPELSDMSKGDRVAFFAKKFVGSPSNLKSDILEAEDAAFTLNVHTFNPLSLISTCVALAQAYETSSAPNWRDFADKYESVMYKGGKARGYVSRFLYSSDWIADNIFRENVTDATSGFDGLISHRREKSIDYISHHRDSFKALADSVTFERLKMLEMGFRNHQIPYLTNGDLTNIKRFTPQAKEGDIFFLITPENDLDSREMGILVCEGDKLIIIQVSENQGKVVMEPLPFDAYVKRNIKRIKGARFVRIK